MGFFSNLDVRELEDINDDPFWIKPGTYKAIVTDCVQKVNDDGSVQCIITWTIDEPSNEYDKNNVQEYYSLYPHYTSWDEYSAEEKKQTKFFRRRLRRAFDLTNEQMAEVEYSQLIGREAYVTLVERDGRAGTKNENKKFINVGDALSQRLFNEERQASDATAASVGLI